MLAGNALATRSGIPQSESARSPATPTRSVKDPAGAAGTAGWARLRNAGDTRRVDLTVSATGGGGDLQLDNTSIGSGQTVTVSTLTITGAP